MGPAKTPLGLLPGRLGVNEEPSDESESDSEREPVNWRGRQTQRSWPKQSQLWSLQRITDPCEPTASEGSVQASASPDSGAAVEVSSPKAEGSPIRRARRGSRRKRNLHHRRELHRREVAAARKNTSASIQQIRRETHAMEKLEFAAVGRCNKEGVAVCTNCPNNNGHWTTNARRSSVSNATRRVTWREQPRIRR
ncbi:unnamed protein product [Trichogramma brassicae]|uniref:Uncharacterized protein n=1 Tax=Trichogramma brassicae TaxID=86971 RepID=A0A6H5I9Y7_9HYME|nr:unnamed protein product [Trichogramma brassicae]